MIIRPIYGYAFCLAKLKNIAIIQKLMSLKKTTFNELIKVLIGYDPEKLCLENIRKAEQRWA